jgi:hypothetical protein
MFYGIFNNSKTAKILRRYAARFFSTTAKVTDGAITPARLQLSTFQHLAPVLGKLVSGDK